MGDLRNKEVINVRDGSRMGYVCDLELDTAAAALTALVVYGSCGCSASLAGSRTW